MNEMTRHSILTKLITIITITLTTITTSWAQSGYWNSYQASGYDSGAGTEAKPYVINTAEQLAYFAARVKSGQDLTSYVELGEDIDLSAHWWIPVGDTGGNNPSNCFKGHFNGNGHCISNMSCEWGSVENYGFFAFINAATIKNIIFDNAYLTNPTGNLGGNGARRVGVLVGGSRNGSKIENIIVRNSKIDITKECAQNNAWDLFGGLVGGIYDAPTIANCYVDVDMDFSKITDYGNNGLKQSWYGLLLGASENNSKPTVTNVFATGTITVDKQRDFNGVGTIIGHTGSGAKNNITESYYVNAPATADGTPLTGTTTSNYNGEQKTESFLSEFLEKASEYQAERSDLTAWKISNGGITFDVISLSKYTDKTKKETVLGLTAPDGTDIEWTVDQSYAKHTLSADKLTLTIPFTNKGNVTGQVTVTTTDEDGTAKSNTMRFTITPLTYSEDLYADSYAGGSGTMDDPYIISNDLELAKLARDVNNASGTGAIFGGKYFKLSADIDLGAALWKPVGTTDYRNQRYFAGKLDGDGNTISNMRMFWDGSSGAWTAYGFFAYLKGEATNEAQFCTVTNVIFDNASLEKKDGSTLTGQGLNIGVVVGETGANAEISNIIIRNSVITDNEATYSVSGTNNGSQYRFGGVIGSIGGNYVVRVYNIAADVDIKVFKNATTNNVPTYMAGIMASSETTNKTNAYHIYPLNLYALGSIETRTDNSYYTLGTISALAKDVATDAQQATYFYANAITEGKYTAYGSQKDTQSFGFTFANICNAFIKDKALESDRYYWKYSHKVFSFTKDYTDISVKPTVNKADKTVTLTLSGNILNYITSTAWTVEGSEVTADEGSNGLSITVPLKNIDRDGTVKIKMTVDGEESENTLGFTITPRTYSEDLYADSYAGGSGTKDDPYLISNDLELAKLARDVNTYATQGMVYSGMYFKLSDNINLDAAIWKPVGDTNYPGNNPRRFAGKLNGNGKTISNAHIYWEGVNGTWTTYGLFAVLQGSAASDAQFCCVSNFILDNACLEKKKGTVLPGNGINVGLIVGEANANVEISNIIVRNSKLTDNGESYTTTNSDYRFSGGIGNFNGNVVTRVFNISVDADINVLKNASISNKSPYIAGLVALNSVGTNGNAIHVFPTNIYVHRKSFITTNDSNSRIYRGGITAKSSVNITAAMQASWYFAEELTGTNAQNYGSRKDIDGFKDSFLQMANQYIQDRGLTDLATWVYSTAKSGFDFGSTEISIDRGETDVLTASTPGMTGELYYWYVSTDRTNWTRITNEDGTPVLANPYTLPYQDYDRYIKAELEDGSSVSKPLYVPALRVSATLDSKTTPGTYTVNVTNNIWPGNNDYLDISYQWTLNDNVVGTGESYTPATAIGTEDNISCHVVVKNKSGKVVLDKWVYTATVVYLKPTDTDNADMTEDARKNDESWGYSEDKPMLTWEGAYSKLEENASWDENIIVLMGKSSKSVTHDINNGFNINSTYKSNSVTQWDNWNKANESSLHRNATITGMWDKNFEGVIEVGCDNDGLPIWADTKFENLTFYYNAENDRVKAPYAIMYCQYNNLEMGKGIRMENFPDSPGYGTIDGANTASLQIFGGLLNDGRFSPLNTKTNIKKMEDAMPHGREGFNITLKSGLYSIVCAGGRQASADSRQNGVMGTANMPVKCTITVDIDRTYNDEYNKGYTYDAGYIIAGNHEGAMYADVDIIIKSGKIARVANGTLGNNRDFSFTYNGTGYTAPQNSYMGRANILLDPASSEHAVKGEDISTTNGRVIVTEMYGGSLGRGFNNNVKINNPFYGYSTITINGGTFKVLPDNNGKRDQITPGIFGAGAGGMTGIGDDAHHTPDDRIPYWSGNDSIMLYGDYNAAKDKFIKYHCYNAATRTYTDVDPSLTNTRIVINGGVFGSDPHPLDGIYAGGSGYMSQGLWTNYSATPNKYGGNMYGKTGETVTSLTINGGTFHCDKGIFAGGYGTDFYYSTKCYGGTAADYTDLGKTYGNVELNINGGEFYSDIFGGGYGVADATLKDTTVVTTLDNMARLYGKSTMNINGGTFYKNIYGGGDMAVVEYDKANDPATNIMIGNLADIRGSVFAGGNGRDANKTQSPEKVGRIIGSTSVAFTGDSRVAPYIYGDIYGGGNLAQVTGDTHVNIYAANFAGELFGGGKGLLNDDKTVNTSADVLGNTNVSLAKDQGGQEDGNDGEKVDYFSINVIWNKLWDAKEGKLYEWNDDTDESDKAKFFDDNEGKFGKFVKSHNIFGGGNVACNVGTYDGDGNVKEGTGLATVSVLKGMTPYSLLKTQEWKTTYIDNDNPHFYVFGGGYGANTKVGSTNVTVDVEGEYGEYDAEVDDDTDQLSKWSPVDMELAANAKTANGKAARKAKAANGKGAAGAKAARESDDRMLEGDTSPVFDNSKGIPNFTILGVLGGGYSGTVTANTKVTVDGNTFLHRVYGGGFGDPESTVDNTTGQVGGNTEVHVQGGHIYGDVFGGGAGVQPATAKGTHFTNVARVAGIAKLEISDDALVYGNVYGGGDMANVGVETDTKPADYYDQSKLTSESTLNQSFGTLEKYEASGYRTFVNIIGGDIFGNVYGGGKGLKKVYASEYEKLGRINGNTLVHVANTSVNYNVAVGTQTTTRGSIGSNSMDSQGNIIPNIWNRIYGGCAYGTVDGNTMVHIEGGMLGLNIFGGGYGDVPIDNDGTDDGSGISTDQETLNQVLGRKDENNEGTYANVLGNTKVQIDGGQWIWNRKADTNGNITIWKGCEAANNKICDNLDEFKQIVRNILKAKKYADITLPKAQAAIARLRTEDDTKAFFDLENRTFKKNHNIFGGGNRACYVGTYNDDGTVASGTGEAVVEINHSPLTDLTDTDDNTISMLDCTTLQGLCWYLAAKTTERPQFSVFGAGYGANTKVGNAKVYIRPGTILSDDGLTPEEIAGKRFRYINQAEDIAQYEEVEDGYREDFLKVSKEEKKLYYGSSDGGNSDGTDNDGNTYIRYRASRMAWSLGIPNFTFLEVHGGGFSGYVTGDTYVETGCQLNCRNIYGAGLGSTPYGDIEKGADYDFGSVYGNSKVFMKAGNVSENVYGGGAGIESVRVSGKSIVDFNAKSGEIVDFPNMALVKGKTEVHIYGRTITQSESATERTMVFGSIYGGGDVANVGTAESAAEQLSQEDYTDESKRTTLVNIRGGKIFSQVFAGGNGRSKDMCANYTKLGGIYGNAVINIDRPGMRYPYCDLTTGKAYNPSDEQYMKHPADDVNPTIIPYLANRVYGGCQNGTVHGNTLVSINDGRYGHNIFGGGLGAVDTTYVDNDATVSVTSADVTGYTNLFISGGETELTSYWLADERAWVPAGIVGEKIYSPQYNHDDLKFKINHNIYAGGNTACNVGGNTYLTMYKGLLYENTKVLAGETDASYNLFETSEWKEVYDKIGSPHFGVFGGGYGENAIVSGDTHVNVAMNTRGSQIINDLKAGDEYKHFYGGYSVMDIIGGGYSGQVVGNTYVEGDGGVFCRRVFGGGLYSSVANTNVTVKAIDCHDIFGGGLMGDVLKSTNIQVGTETTTEGSTYTNADIYVHGDIYGGNDVSGYVNVTLDQHGYFADNGGDGTHINIYGGKIDGNVYGAGNGDYLYALDKKGNTKVTVNEHYPLNPDDPNSEKEPLVYTVPMRDNMPSYKAASDAAKIVNINSWRPLTNKVTINIKGEAADDGKKVVIKGDVYGGGNSATVQKVQAPNVRASKTVGFINLNIGSHVNIGRVFMGCNGDALFTASEDNNFMNKFLKLNGDVYDYSKELNLADSIDWVKDPSNRGISTLYLPTESSERPLVYPHLLDLYFQPVETDIQGELKWAGSEDGNDLTDCTIGTFCCGGNRGNMNVYPLTEEDYAAGTAADKMKVGNVLDYVFPAGLTITDKIVGGCNNANYNYKGIVTHEGGYLLGRAKSSYPFIKLTVRNEFQPEEKDNAYVGGNVYGGCYKAGTVRGDVTILLESDMLKGKSKEKIEKSNDFVNTISEFSALNVYGAGYGMESYVHGNTRVTMGEGIPCVKPSTTDGIFNASGTSANFVYGGGQQGNVIGITNVDILNGHVFKSVTGGSYSGYVWGSTHVRVGYPKYYTVKLHKTGKFILNRADQNNKDIDNGKKVSSETIKQSICLLFGDVVSQTVYDAIIAQYDEKSNSNIAITDANRSDYFTEVPAEDPAIGWDNININIDEAVYGGGYSLSQKPSENEDKNTTVLKFTKDYNIDQPLAVNEGSDVLAGLPGGTTVGFGGNTTIVIADRTTKADNAEDRDHITISHQDMKVANVADGQDILHYYYKDTKGDYHYIYQAGLYYQGGNLPDDIDGTVIYEVDNEGGVFGDGHLSYAQGYRSADLTGYGFASTTILSPKIINTFQRLDALRLTDNCFSLLGARDFATNANDKSPYSISRVGEIQMIANDIKTDNGTLADHDKERARNYMGFANNIQYVAALTSNVAFTDPWHDGDGATGESMGETTYQSIKQKYIDNYDADNDGTDFEKRNNGTAKNMIGIASGYALKVQNVQELVADDGSSTSKLYYGPIYGVIEMNLIDVREDEGGGYVYADNVHKRATATDGSTHAVDFLETTGNFVFPYTSKQGRYVVDDCFPLGYQSLTGTEKADPDNAVEAHYWYVTGFNYHYTAHITGFTYDTSGTKTRYFNSNNTDGIVSLSGAKAGQEVNIVSWKMHSAHYNDSGEYSCDLEKRNYDTSLADVYGKYTLHVGASNAATYDEQTKDKDNPGFAALLPMNEDVTKDDVNIITSTLPTKLTDGNARIVFRLADNVDNSTTNYYKSHLSQPCKATLVFSALAKDDDGQTIVGIPLTRLYTRTGSGTAADPYVYTMVTNGNLAADKEYFYRSGETDFYQSTKDKNFYTIDENGNKTEVEQQHVTLGNKDVIFYCELDRYYTYTVDLTIEYVQGPDIEGHITIENCALPGERIRVKKDNLVINADQAFSVNGYYWRIGKRHLDETTNEWIFDDTTPWSKTGTTSGYDTYKQADKEGKGMFAGCYYDKTEDYLDIPAYYYMDGYGIQLGVTMNVPGIDDIFPVKMQEADRLTVHNYQRMNPHKSGIDLHLAEAVIRANEDKDFPEPRIYLSDQNDLVAFVNFVDTIGTQNTAAPRYGAKAQFVLQNDLTVTSGYDGSGIADFAGTVHGNGHVISGLDAGSVLVNSISGNIYNVGLASGRISNMELTDGKIPNYHCCFEYEPEGTGSNPYVYHMDGSLDKGYTTEDFRLGRVAYDLNEYYLRARYSNETKEDMAALKYVYDYYANGDYQYAHRTDAITGNNTGITYLRTGLDSDLPNYEQAETRHDKTHSIDKARAQNYVAATADAAESRTGDYLPLFNAQGYGTDEMNDFLFWGQSLQSSPALYPAAIASRQTDYMTNRVYRAAGYYGDTKLDAYHYNAYKRGNSSLSTYVHDVTTTAIDFTCRNDEKAYSGRTDSGIFYAPLQDNATTFSDFIVKDGVTRNLLVYTAANNNYNDAEAYNAVANSIRYTESTKEGVIRGHHISANDVNATSFSTDLLHLVERNPKGYNSEGDVCDNNNFCVPIPFTVNTHAWYTRKPMYYATDNTGAWEGICLPFTVHKVSAAVNGEITHFYGTPTEKETADPAQNFHTLHHEYWLRGLTAINQQEATTSAVFLRPGTAGSKLFAPVDADGKAVCSSQEYIFNNSFFTDAFDSKLYNKADNPYYTSEHSYLDYLPLTANVPYIVRFPGERYYEFDLSSKFYNNILSRSLPAQNVTFNAYGVTDANNTSYGTVTIPVTTTMETTTGSFAHRGTFMATSVETGSVYGMNSGGTAFDDASSFSTVMPFRTYMSPVAKTSAARFGSVVYIAEAQNIDRIVPEIAKDSEEDAATGDYFRVRPVGEHRVRIESSRAMTLHVVTATGQLYRVLDVRPGSALYSGFMPGIYLFGNLRVMVQQ